MNEVKFTFDGNKTTAVYDGNLQMLESIRDVFLPRMIAVVKSGVIQNDFTYSLLNERKLDDSK